MVTLINSFRATLKTLSEDKQRFIGFLEMPRCDNEGNGIVIQRHDDNLWCVCTFMRGTLRYPEFYVHLHDAIESVAERYL